MQMPRIWGLAAALAVGAADGAAASTDAKANRNDFSKQRATWVEGGALITGLALELFLSDRVHLDVSEALVNSSAALIVSKQLQHAMSKTNPSYVGTGTPPTVWVNPPVYGYKALVAGGQPALPAPQAYAQSTRPAGVGAVA